MSRAPFTPMRTRLKDRRAAVLRSVAFDIPGGRGTKHFEVGFGFDDAGTIREVFCTSPHDGSDLKALMHDACIAISRSLQFGDVIADMAKSFGELREEGAKEGLPASPLGAIARAGAALEAELRSVAQVTAEDGA